MKQLLNEMKSAFSERGYRKAGNSFWKVENGFYKLVNFQKGAYGDYFFVNVGLHPIGLPSFITGKLEVKERPKEYECILRHRIEEIVPINTFKKALVPVDCPEISQEIILNLPQIEKWLMDWSSFEVLANAEFEILSKMMTTVVPILWEKAYWMLKYYCMVKMGALLTAKEYLKEYFERNQGMDFGPVDRYLTDMLTSNLTN